MLKSIIEKLDFELKGNSLILGIGNTLRSDDGFGSLLAKKIKDATSLKVIDAGNSPENFLGSVIKEKPDTVLIVDAVDFGGKAGDIRLFDSESVKTGNFFLTHNTSLSLIFEFLRERVKAKFYLLAIQPKDIGFGDEMSPEAKGRLEELGLWLLRTYPQV